MPPTKPPVTPPEPSDIYEKLRKVRESKTLSLKPIPLLRETITGFDGTPQPFGLRYYQCQGVYHLLVLRRMVLGDDMGLGKTVETIAALCYQWQGEPDNKVIVVCPKSALQQWAGEIERFTNGVKPLVASGSVKRRQKAYDAFFGAPPGEKTVLLLNYHCLKGDWKAGSKVIKVGGKATVSPGLLDGLTAKVAKTGKLVVVYDEATAFKNSGTQTWQVCKFLSDRAWRCYGLTGTLLKNNLMEGFSIYKAIKPDLFGTKTKFIEDYCVTQRQPIPGGRFTEVIVGYKNLAGFRSTIDPFFLGRKKHEVSSELPVLTTREVVCELSAAEEIKYAEALEGVLALGEARDNEVKDYEETKALTSLIYTQQVADSLALLGFEDGATVPEMTLGAELLEHKVEMSAKERALVDLLTEDLEGEKTIVYTRFASHVKRLQALLAKAKIKSVCVTGAENDKKREEAKKIFQDLKSDVSVIFITDAGSDAINLQAASSLVFFNAPWSWGNYLQILGRMIRIGSPHRGVYAVHLVAERPRDGAKARKTIDHHVLQLLRAKRNMIDKVLGEGAVGALSFDRGGDMKALVEAMKGRGA